MADCRKRKVGTRQSQKIVKKSISELFKDVDDSDEWLVDSDTVAPLPVSSNSLIANSQTLDDVSLSPQNSAEEEAGNLQDRDSVNSVSPSVIRCNPTRISEVFSETGSDSDSKSEVETTVTLSSRLRIWALQQKVSHQAVGALLKELSPYFPDLPADPRTLLFTPRVTKIKSLDNGDYAHIGLLTGLLSRLKHGIPAGKTLTDPLGLDINIDGLSFSKSSSVDVWPILARCLDIIDQRPFVVGLFCGTSKPSPLDLYLHDYIKDVEALKDGIDFQGNKLTVFVRCYICDAPARAYIKCVKGHGGYSSCERCWQEGQHDDHRMCYDAVSSHLRTDESFIAQEDEAHHTGLSPLNILNVRFVSEFPLDPMHLVLEGVMRRFLQYVVHKAQPGVRLRASATNIISTNQVDLDSHIPLEFARKPRSLNFLGRWKATELRLFLLYTGIVVLKGPLPDQLYSTFLLFHTAIRIISSKDLLMKPENVDYAEKLLSTFVQHCADKTVFGPTFVVYNVHSLLHLCDDVRRFGVISDFSAFPFENHLGIIKRMARTPNLVLQQLVRRLAERDFLYEAVKPAPHSLIACGYEEATGTFKSLSCANFTLTLKTKDSFFSMGEGSIGSLKMIRRTGNGEVDAVADIYEDVSDFFTYPCKSSDIGIIKFGLQTRANVTITLESIKTKLMVLPLQNQRVAIPLLHTC